MRFRLSLKTNLQSIQKRENLNKGGIWRGAQGLAEDVRYYGKWIRDEAEKRIGHLYPKVELPEEHGGGKATVIAWLWARTVKCPNPACGCQMPLVRSFQLSKKKGKEAWVEPIIDNSQNPPVIKFEVKTGEGKPIEGTTSRKGAVCLACATPTAFDYICAEAKAERMNAQLMAIVAEGDKRRIYLSPNKEQECTAASAEPEWKPESDLLQRDELPENWNPAKDDRTPDWEATQHLIQTLDKQGETGAAILLAQLGDKGEICRDLAYRVYVICDRQGWTQDAISYNSLVTSWSEISRLAVMEQQLETVVQRELVV